LIAGSSGCRQASDELLASIRALELELHHPGVRCTKERLEQLLHPDFHEVGRSGRPYDRATIVRYLSSLDVRPHVVSDAFALAELGEGVTLLTFRSAQVQDDGTRTTHTHRSSLWLKTDTGWRLRYHQGTPAADAW
jgi:hypothetical protein